MSDTIMETPAVGDTDTSIKCKCKGCKRSVVIDNGKVIVGAHPPVDIIVAPALPEVTVWECPYCKVIRYYDPIEV